MTAAISMMGYGEYILVPCMLSSSELDRLGIFIFRLPGSPRDFEVREVGEGASVKADEELD